jgi:hypothetical protein
VKAEPSYLSATIWRQSTISARGCVLLRSGKVAFEGTAEETTARYIAMTSEHGMAQLSERQDRAGNGTMRATYIALWDAKWNRINSILPNRPFAIELEYQCEDSVRDFGVSVDIETRCLGCPCDRTDIH